ncbi:ATP-binding protein [Caldalkalibacillus mannanilyticus]|uniref:ATP-binding protein n=1 Tax=Caldalkalibacillus mannanilyticus TaxID=1418 RepID=UPI0004682949|nr:ATP-binding protein [Caldalkalibacillus mannanilyticus]
MIYSGYDPRKRIWYQQAIDHPHQIIRTSPYLYYSPKGLEALITIAKTVYNSQGELIGVMGIDRSTTQLSDFLETIVIGDRGYLFLFDSNGALIAHPEREISLRHISQLDLKNIESNHHDPLPATKLLSHTTGQFEMMINGEQSLIFLRTSETTGFKLAAVIAKGELTTSSEYLLDIVLASSLIGSLMIVVIIFFTAQRWKKKWAESDQRYRSLFEYHPSATFSSTTDGTIISINKSFEQLTGFTYLEVAHQSVFSFISIDTIESASYYLHKVNQGFPQHYQLKIYHKNTSLIDIEVTNVPIIVNSRIVGVYWIAKDITNQKQAEEYMVKSEKLSIAGQLAAGIAHEIRNPLTSLKGFLQLMNRSGESKEEYFQIMRDELDRIELILSELLMLAKPQATLFQEKDIRTILLQVVTLLESQALLNNVLIQTLFADTPLPCYCDEHQIKQVFINMMKNGIESMTNGGLFLIETVKEKEFMMIRFIDHGKGISADLIQKIGEPFYTTKERGTGLGLMVSYKIIESHGGSIRIQSEVGKGTTFEVLLPLSQEKEHIEAN